MTVSGLTVNNETSVLDIRNIGTPAISSLVIAGNKTEAHKFVMVLMVGVNRFFGGNWLDGQLKELSIDFYESHHYWKAADFKLFYSRCKSLYYGKVYGAFSPALLMEWAKLYDDEWMETSERLAENRNQRFKKEEQNTPHQVHRNRAESEQFFSKLYKNMTGKPKPNLNDGSDLSNLV